MHSSTASPTNAATIDGLLRAAGVAGVTGGVALALVFGPLPLRLVFESFKLRYRLYLAVREIGDRLDDRR